MSHQIFGDVDADDIDLFDDYDDTFRFALTTRRLLAFTDNVAKLGVLQTDATYKLVWQGYPVLLVGFSDADKCFIQFV